MYNRDSVLVTVEHCSWKWDSTWNKVVRDLVVLL